MLDTDIVPAVVAAERVGFAHLLGARVGAARGEQESGYGHGSKPGPASVANVGSALKSLAKLAKLANKEKFSSIALPRVATGVGGLSWSDVEPLIERHLGALEIPVNVYAVYLQGVVASEV